MKQYCIISLQTQLKKLEICFVDIQHWHKSLFQFVQQLSVFEVITDRWAYNIQPRQSQTSLGANNDFQYLPPWLADAMFCRSLPHGRRLLIGNYWQGLVSGTVDGYSDKRTGIGEQQSAYWKFVCQ